MSLSDHIGSLLFGKNYIPVPGNNESVLDAIERQNRNIDALSVGARHIGGFLHGDPFKASKSLVDASYDPAFTRTFGGTQHSAADADNALSALRESLTKKAVERLKGGRGDNKPDRLFDKKELARGEKHEREHTRVKSIAKEIAKDHLSERKDYYSALDKSGLE